MMVTNESDCSECLHLGTNQKLPSECPVFKVSIIGTSNYNI